MDNQRRAGRKDTLQYAFRPQVFIGCHPQRHHHHHHPHHRHGCIIVVDDYHHHVKPCSAHFVHRSTSKGSLLVVVVLLEGQLWSPTFRDIKSNQNELFSLLSENINEKEIDVNLTGTNTISFVSTPANSYTQLFGF